MCPRRKYVSIIDLYLSEMRKFFNRKIGYVFERNLKRKVILVFGIMNRKLKNRKLSKLII